MSSFVSGLRGIITGVIILLVILAIAFSLELFGLQWSKFFAPKRENIRREVFEETKSYNEGKEQDLIRYRLQYMQAKTDEEKKAIASTIRLMFADYNEELLSDELRNFLKQMKYGE